MSFFKDAKDYDQKLNAIKGRIVSEETRAKLRVARAKQGTVVTKHSEETKAKMRASAINRHGIKCHTPDGIFDSLKLAAKHYGKTERCIHYRVLGINGKKGDKWRDWYIVE